MRFIGKIFSLALTILFLITMYLIYRLNILPIKYLLGMGSILLLIVLILDIKLIKKGTKTGKRFFYIFISGIFIGGIVYLLTYINATYDFMNNMVFDKLETITYDVIVDKNSSYEKIGDLSNLSIGYLNNDKNYSKMKLFIRKDIKYNGVEYKDINNMINSLSLENICSIVLEDSYYDAIKEEYDYIRDNTKVIKKYKLIVKKEKEKEKQTVNTDKPFIIYISGIDTYGKITSVSRSDVNIVAVVNPNKGKILLLSIPRDYYVNLHSNNEKDKLTHAGLYGIDESKNTIRDLLDIDINYYLRINFSTLTKCIDLLGGVDVYSDMTFNPTAKPSLTIKEGINHMDGEMALAFARERYQYRTGDRHRGQNQQAIITAVIKKLSNPSIITKYKGLLNSLDGSFETNMDYKNITNLVKMQLDKNIDWDVESISLDGDGSMMSTYSMGERKLYVMIPDEETIKTAKEKIEITLSGDE